MAISKPFRAILSARRKHFNSRVHAARSGNAGFDIDLFSNVLARDVDGIVQAVWAAKPDAAPRVAEDVFEMALNLVAQRRLGPGVRNDIVGRIWQNVAPSMAELIALDAYESLGAITNSAIYLSGVNGIKTDDWVEQLKVFAPQVGTIEQLRHLVTVTAWRAGGAHFRTAGMKAADALPANTACAVLGSQKHASWKDLSKALAQNIWWSPEISDFSGRLVGGFTGLGGPFGEPPIVKAVDDGFLALSAGRHFHLTVDGFGAIFQSADAEDWADANQHFAGPEPKIEGHKVSVDGNVVDLGMTPDGLSVVCNLNSVAVVSPHSYSFHVLPRRMPA